MASWVRINSTAGLTFVDIDKAVTAGALEDPNTLGSYVVGVWFESDAEPGDFQTIEGSYGTLGDAEAALRALVQGYDPT